MKRVVYFALLLGLIMFAGSCQNPEDVTISKYFAAMKHGESGDRDTMNSMSVDPRFIQFKEYEIVTVEPIRELDLQLPLLEKKLNEITEARKGQASKAKDANDNLEDVKFELEGTAARSAKRTELEAKLAEAETAKKSEEDKFKALTVQINGLKKMVDFEKNLIKLSSNVFENFDFYSGKMQFVDVLVKVIADDGAESNYTFVLTKYDLMMENKPLARSRYVILKILSAEEQAKVEKPEDYYKKALSGAVEAAPAEEPAPVEETKEAPVAQQTEGDAS